MALGLLLAFLLVPIVEIWVIIQVGHVVGAAWTVVLLLAESAIGAWILRREGRRAWARLRQAMTSGVVQGRLPDRELADGGMLLIGGTLLLTPGFVTDVVGFALVLPPSRALLRPLVLRWLTRRAHLVVAGAGGSTWGRGPGGGPFSTRSGAAAEGPVVEGQVVEGEVLDVRDDPPQR
ncbi:MAG: FxsA family protein [Motilibacteraceae bacterium]